MTATECRMLKRLQHDIFGGHRLEMGVKCAGAGRDRYEPETGAKCGCSQETLQNNTN